MIKIAIVEDEDGEAETLLGCLGTYEKEIGEKFSFTRFCDAGAFLDTDGSFDIVFLDIMLPGMTGMDAAAKLREKDKKVVIIFVTTLAQFAVKGYEVDALDYIIKPVSYERLTLKMQKAVGIVRAGTAKPIVINSTDGVVKTTVDNIIYIEVRGHKLLWHTRRGVFGEYASLSALEKTLKVHNFMRCNSCYLVNPKFIERVNGSELSVILTNGEELKISQPRRKSFITELTNWLGQGRC